MLERFADADVLLIDDNESNVALLRTVLERASLRGVRCFTDPRAAMAQMELRRPDLVLVDLHMPHLDGYAVLERIAEYAAGSYLPALVLTADASAEARQRALRAGAQDFVTKPFDAIEVVLRVRNLLEIGYLHNELRQKNRWLRGMVEEYRADEKVARVERRMERIRVESVLRDESITMHFQPIAEIATGRIVGLEALARFPVEPRRGPDVWFAEAARVGLGVELEFLAASRAIEALRLLPPAMFLAVNVSPATLLDSQGRLAAQAQGVASRLILELTEHSPVEDYEALNSAISAFRDHGARLAVDDTGAGYAGFRHLLALRPDVVKLDLSLTRGIDLDPARRALASALVRFSRDTEAELVAEGVEVAAELETLRNLGVPWTQGYHVAMPQPLHAVLAACERGHLDIADPAQGPRVGRQLRSISEGSARRRGAGQ